MKRKQYSEEQIITIPKEAEAGATVADVIRKHGIADGTYYRWKAKYGGMDALLMARMKELEAENNRLKKMYADVQLQNDVIREAMAKKW